MNIDRLREILKEHNLFVKEKNKNIICICPICGDHKNPRKKGHLYVSTDPDKPIAHCFFCDSALSVSNLIKKITGSSNISKEVITPEEEKRAQYKHAPVRKAKQRTVQYKLSNIEPTSFPNKRLYIKKRSINKLNPEEVPNLIFDFKNFFHYNRLNIVGNEEGKTISNQEFNIISQNFIGFLSRHHTTIYGRNTDSREWLQFKKIHLQNDPFRLLDYWCMPGGDPSSDTVVLAEGNFDIIGEYVSDSLKIKDSVRLYASGNSFSYSSLIKSVCFDENLYKCTVVILSDNDKKLQWYNKFKEKNNHVIKKTDIWWNKSGKDFGVFPVRPFKYTYNKD